MWSLTNWLYCYICRNRTSTGVGVGGLQSHGLEVRSLSILYDCWLSRAGILGRVLQHAPWGGGSHEVTPVRLLSYQRPCYLPDIICSGCLRLWKKDQPTLTFHFAMRVSVPKSWNSNNDISLTIWVNSRFTAIISLTFHFNHIDNEAFARYSTYE